MPTEPYAAAHDSTIFARTFFPVERPNKCGNGGSIKGSAFPVAMKARGRLPVDASLAKSINHIVVSGGLDTGGHAQIRTIETFQGDGDRSVMTIETGES